MFSTLKYCIIIISLIAVCLFLTSAPLVLAADKGVDKALGGLKTTAEKGGMETGQTDLPIIIGRVAGSLLAFVGVVFFCLILWAGFSWMMAKGNEEEIGKAKEIIITAVLGLIVILGAYAITNLVAFIFSQALGK